MSRRCQMYRVTSRIVVGLRQNCSGKYATAIPYTESPSNQSVSTNATPDEFLFLTDHPEMPLAFVHLTWAVETDPVWPWTKGFASIAEWAAWMKGCHESYLQAEKARLDK